MAEFNYYNLYSYAGQDFKNATDGKVLVDLKKLGNLKDYDEILNFINSNFGEIALNKEFDFPNDIKVLVHQIDESIILCAMQGEKQIFGSCWTKVQEE